MGMLQFGRTIVRSLFKPPATTGYPAVPRDYPEGTRGKVAIRIEDCIYCGLCMRKCPADAIAVDRAGKTWTIDPFSCIQCACCVEQCPKKCLSMGVQYTAPATSKTEEAFHARVPDDDAAGGDCQP